MIYTQRLKCNIDEAWDILEASLKYEIEETTKETIDMKDIQKGYHYQKKMHATRGGEMSVKVLIRELTKPTKYAVEFTSTEGVNNLSYTLEAIDEYQCQITYEETYEAKKKLNGWNAKLVSFFMKGRNKKKVKRVFKNIEKFALENRIKKEDEQGEKQEG